jgi:hypothetical protein
MTRNKRQRYIDLSVDLRMDALRLAKLEHTPMRSAQIVTLRRAADIYDQLANEAEVE